MIKNHYKLISFKDINFNISKNVIGKDLSINNNSVHTLNDKRLKYYTEINRLNFETLAQSSLKLTRQLNITEFDSELIPIKIKNNCLSQFKSITENKLTDYYFSVLPSRYKLTDAVKESTYDHVTSVTGRMKITKGLNYLTLKKSKRIETINYNKDNILLEIDIKSCEPALLHAVLYNETPEDIYSFFGKGVERQKVKIAIISSLYGSSPDRVKKMSGIEKKEIKKIVDHFQIEKIKELVTDQFNKEGYFHNLYGRPIHDITSPVNYWLQSSAADYSCLAFLNLVERLNLKVKAVIHDAIIVEIDKEKHSVLKRIKMIKDPITNIRLRVEQSIIT